MFGADSSRSLIFDADATRTAVRQRAVAQDETRPPVVRRVSPSAAAPGHNGRKRGEVVRSRMTVQLRSTSEWLGTFGEPGNGDANAAVERVCRVVRAYLDARGLPLSLGVVRVDGEHGWLHRIARIAEYGLGYLVRCRDYKILKDPRVVAALAAGAIARTVHEDTGVTRELFDLPAYRWKTMRSKARSTRLIVARRRVAPEAETPIGKRVGEWVYEMIATDRPASQWDAAQVFALYLERGAFERTLGEEDRELPTDRWVTYQENGEELWQILCQWIWNLRLRRGAQASNVAPDREVFDTVAEAIRGEPVTLPPGELVCFGDASDEDSDRAPETPAEPPVSEAVAGEPSPPPVGAVVPAAFGTGAFRQRDAHTAICPAGVEMHAAERRYLAKGYRIRYAAPPARCATCEWSEPCRGSDDPAARGRRVTMRDWPTSADPAESGPTTVMAAPVSTPVAPSVERAEIPSWEVRWEPTPLWHETLRAAALRRYLPALLRGQRIHSECAALPPPPPEPPRRSQRAKRRTRWLERWSRNLLTTRSCTITLTGVPDELAKMLDLPTIRAS